MDELQIGIAPAVLGGGKALFDAATAEGLRLEKIRVVDSPTMTDFWYRVVKV